MMAEENEQETFTFVDKRRTSDESQAQPDVQEEKADEQDWADSDGDSPEDAGGDTLGSYGLAAYVTGLIASDAWQKMGLIPDPSTGVVTRDLAQAKFSIDCVAAVVGLIEQRESIVPERLLSDLKRVLNDLRLNYVEQSRR
jgi:hypothetical protein